MKTLLVLLALLCFGCNLSEQINKMGPDLFMINSFPITQAETGCKLS